MSRGRRRGGVCERFRFTSLFAGVDLGEEHFHVCLIDEMGSAAAEQGASATTGQGSDRRSPGSRRSPARAESAVAIESPRGAVVGAFLEAGFEVFSINPKQLDRFRDRFTVAGAKDDRLDARVLGDSLRTDRRAFRRLSAEPGWLVRMRQASRMEDELKEECRRSANRLRPCCTSTTSSCSRCSPAADEPWFWDLVALAPTPERGARLRPKQVERLLQEHRIRRITAQEVIDRLGARRCPPCPASPRRA